MSLCYNKLNAKTYCLAKKYAESDYNSKMVFRNKKQMQIQLESMCTEINSEISNHIKTGFNMMMANPGMHKLISDVEQIISDKQPDYIEFRSSVEDQRNSYWQGGFHEGTQYYERVLSLCGLNLQSYGLPRNFCFEECFDFWALIYGLISKFSLMGLRFRFINTGYNDTYLTYQSPEDCFNYFINSYSFYRVDIKMYERDVVPTDVVAICDTLLNRYFGIIQQNYKSKYDVFSVFKHFLDSTSPCGGAVLQIFRKKQKEDRTTNREPSWY